MTERPSAPGDSGSVPPDDDAAAPSQAVSGHAAPPPSGGAFAAPGHAAPPLSTTPGTLPAAAAPRWDAPCGRVIGWRDGPVDRATGIRYANAGRFERPTPVAASSAEILATDPAPACPQPPMPFLDDVVGSNIGALPQDEDCLRVSVTTPANTPPVAGLPVMVWIHGGSYASGAGDAPFYDPRALVSEQSVIVVNVTYRLGLLGFLGDGERIHANLGLLDMIAALRWTRENIAAFGGDPANVTAFGQSAGGDAVAHLMIADGARGLFHRAIIQSAPFGLLAGRAKMSELMATTASALARDASLDDVRTMQQRVAKAATRFGLKGQMPFGLQYGHDPLPPETELDRHWREAAPHVAVLVGNTTREAALFTARIPPLLRRMNHPRKARGVERILISPFTQRLYGRGARRFAQRHVSAGGTGARYEFSWGVGRSPIAAAHISELPLLFPGPAWVRTPMVEGHTWADVLADGARLRRAWADFARGEPVTSDPRAGLRVFPPEPGRTD